MNCRSVIGSTIGHTAQFNKTKPRANLTLPRHNVALLFTSQSIEVRNARHHALYRLRGHARRRPPRRPTFYYVNCRYLELDLVPRRPTPDPQQLSKPLRQDPGNTWPATGLCHYHNKPQPPPRQEEC